MPKSDKSEVSIRFLSFQGCPGIAPTLERLRAVLADEGVVDDIEMVDVPDAESARREHFLGSPSIQINGLDIEEDRRADKPCFGCRVYPNGEPVPPEELIRTALGYL